MQNKRIKNAFITGCTGHIGGHILRKLIKRGYNIYALIRSDSNYSTIKKLKNKLEFLYDDRRVAERCLRKIKIIEGDIREKRFGLDNKQLNKILKIKFDYVIHSAADTDLTKSLKELYLTNVEGTDNVLRFSMKAYESNEKLKVCYLSTIFVVGDGKSKFTEELLNINQKFNNNYEESKYKAEMLVNKYNKYGLQVLTFRPSLVAGDSKIGRTDSYKVFYQLIRFLKKGLLDYLPVNSESRFNIINVDVVADQILIIAELMKSGIYHTVSLNNIKITDFINRAAKYFQFSPPVFINTYKYGKKLTPSQQLMIAPFLPYLNFKGKITFEKTKSILFGTKAPLVKIGWTNIKRQFQYCIDSGFINK